MKKLFLLLPLATLMFVSCSNDEQFESGVVRPNVPDGAIWFSSDLQEMTRTAITMSNFDKFNVTAVHADADYSFTDLEVTKSSTTSTWGYDTGSDPSNPVYKYWPLDNSAIKFYAYAPVTIKNNITSPDKLVAFQQVQHVVDQIDVLAAYATGNKSSNASSGVTLKFRHALSQIEVKAKNSDATNYKVKVLGVKLCRIGDTGNMDFQTNSNADPTWGSQSGSQNFIKKGASIADAFELTAQAQNIMFGSDNFLMLPQQLTQWTGSDTDTQGAYLSVLCLIQKKNGSNWEQVYPVVEGTETPGLYGFSAVPIKTNWVPGHKYIYTLDFFGQGGGAGQIDPDPTNPETKDGGSDNPDAPQSDGDIDTTPGGSGGKGGDPTVDTDTKPAVKFSIDIFEWTTGVGDEEGLDL